MIEEWVFYIHPDGSPGTGEALAHVRPSVGIWVIERKTDKSFYEGKGDTLVEALENFNWVWTRHGHEPLLLQDVLISKQNQERATKELGCEFRSWGGALTSRGTED